MMKQFISVAALVAFVAAQDTTDATAEAAVDQPSSSCLFCRKEDKDSGFLTSYSFCEHKDECL